MFSLRQDHGQRGIFIYKLLDTSRAAHAPPISSAAIAERGVITALTHRLYSRESREDRRGGWLQSIYLVACRSRGSVASASSDRALTVREGTA